MSEQITPEEIQKHWLAAMDSVNFINEINAGEHDDMTEEEKTDALQRNVDHLKIMLAKDFWTTEDLQPFRDAIA